MFTLCSSLINKIPSCYVPFQVALTTIYSFNLVKFTHNGKNMAFFMLIIMFMDKKIIVMLSFLAVFIVPVQMT